MEPIGMNSSVGMDPMQEPVNKAMRQAVEDTIQMESNLVKAAVNPSGDVESALAENAVGQFVNVLA
jgi:hypothetical protein